MALNDQHIFILGTAKFDGPYESTSFTLAKYLAKENHVYYIENPYTWKDYFRYKGSPEFEKRKDYFKKSSNGLIDSDIPKLKILVTPPLLSINFLPEGVPYRLLLKVNESIIAKRIKKILSERKLGDFIFINSFNFHYPNIADLIKPRLTVYHCVDPLIVPFDMKHGLTSEPILVKNSDLVICTSQQLYREKKAMNPRTYFVPNAADIGHSSKALERELEVHPKLKHLPRPLIGYFGNIERRMDFSLIQQLTEMNPEKSFVFVGPISPEFVPDWFHNTPNIYHIGRQSYDQMPSIIKGFDVAIIPFKKDEVSNTIFPLKLFEYLGAGKPVVATDFNLDLEDFTEDVVAYSPDAFRFTHALNTALNNQSLEEINKRLKIAKENTWENRLAQFDELLNNHF